MDLQFKRYASPFLLIDEYISSSLLSNFIDDFTMYVNEDRTWEFFLHKVFDETWDDFNKDMKPTVTKPVDLGATIKKSKKILSNFTPERGD